MKPASQVSGMELNCADQRAGCRVRTAMRIVHSGTLGASIRRLPWKSREDSGERGDRWDLGDQGHRQEGGVRSMGSNTGF